MLLAVHISDGILAAPWWLGGFALAAVLLFLGARRLPDEEVPRVALLTAVFFIASLFRIPFGPTTVHLLCNGLVGVLLGLRAGLAIWIGLFLQVLLSHHGGFTTLGINTCVLTLPALLSFFLFRALNRLPWLGRPWFRSLLVGLCGLSWILSGIYSIALPCTNARLDLSSLDMGGANAVLAHPVTWAISLGLTVALIWIERRFESAPEFPLGLLIGEVAVLATLGLNVVVLLLGGETVWPGSVLIWVVIHLPIAVVEGVVLGFTVGFLAKVKPEMLFPSSQQTAIRGKANPGKESTFFQDSLHIS